MKVHFITTACEDKAEEVEKKRKNSQGKKEKKRMPSVAKNYRNNYWFVDSNDKDLSYYKIGRVSKRWWQPLFWNFIEMAISNSYCIHKHNAQKTKQKFKNRKEFRLELAESLMGSYCSKKNPAKKFQNDGMHLVVKVSKAQCKYRNCKSRVVTKCDSCNIHICLHHFQTISC